MTDIVIKLLSLGILLSDIAIAVFMLLFLYNYFTKGEFEYFKSLKELLGKYGNKLALVFAGTSVLGSLFLSEMANLNPCTLCWYQRMLMYPIAVILAVGLYFKKRDFRTFILPLSLFGVLVSSYHYYLQNTASSYDPCSESGLLGSCSEKYSVNFGFVTIPFMALTAFVLISLLVYFGSGRTNKSSQAGAKKHV